MRGKYIVAMPTFNAHSEYLVSQGPLAAEWKTTGCRIVCDWSTNQTAVALQIIGHCDAMAGVLMTYAWITLMGTNSCNLFVDLDGATSYDSEARKTAQTWLKHNLQRITMQVHVGNRPLIAMGATTVSMFLGGALNLIKDRKSYNERLAASGLRTRVMLQ